MIEFREYEHTALRSIQDWSSFPTGTPLYECIVVNTNTLGAYEQPAARQPQGMARRAMASSVQQNVPLHLDLETVGADLLFKMTFDARRFEGASITRLMEHLVSLLENITEDPDRRVADLPLMTSRERQQILVDWNRTEKPVPAFYGLHQSLRSPGAQSSGRGGRALRQRRPPLRRPQRPGQPACPLSACTRGRTRCDHRDLHPPVPQDGDGAAGGAEVRCGLRATRSELPPRAARFHAEGLRA